LIFGHHNNRNNAEIALLNSETNKTMRHNYFCAYLLFGFCKAVATWVASSQIITQGGQPSPTVPIVTALSLSSTPKLRGEIDANANLVVFPSRRDLLFGGLILVSSQLNRSRCRYHKGSAFHRRSKSRQLRYSHQQAA
jgi:hypothetical protein